MDACSICIPRTHRQIQSIKHTRGMGRFGERCRMFSHHPAHRGKINKELVSLFPIIYTVVSFGRQDAHYQREEYLRGRGLSCGSFFPTAVNQPPPVEEHQGTTVRFVGTNKIGTGFLLWPAGKATPSCVLRLTRPH